MSEATVTDALALAEALGAMGIPCDVESRGGLAVVTTTAANVARFATPDARRVVLALARRYGFTHLAAELPTSPVQPGAPVLRD